MVKFSIIIPTYNRINDLRDTLNSIKKQNYSKDLFEVIVVDGGTPSFISFIKEFKNDKNFKFINNATRGASSQRNIGIEHARGEFLAFIDDDANAEPDWLRNYSRNLHLENLGVLAGRIRPLWDTNVKNYHKQSDYITSLYSIFDLGEEIKEIEYGFSCNYIIRRKALEEAGGFNPNHGRIGDDRVLYGEDVIICQKISRKYKNYYIPNAIVYHKVLNYRLTWNWLIKRAYAGGLTKGLQNRKPKPYKKLQLNIYDYVLLTSYAWGYFRGKLQSWMS